MALWTGVTRLLLVLTLFVLNWKIDDIKAQNIFDRFRPTNATTQLPHNEELVKIVSGTKVKRFERLTVPLSGVGGGGIGGSGLLLNQPNLHGYGAIFPNWLAGARLMGEGDEAAINGYVLFQPLAHNNDIKVTINVTGLPPGKHALHIHTYGDISQGCKSTGGQFPNNFLGNVDTKEDGSISAAFLSIYLNLFGFNGIVGRSIVIHSKAIDLNTALNAEVFSTSLQAVPDALAYQTEENSVGPAIACGVISVMSANMANAPK